MSHSEITYQWVESISLAKYCDHESGGARFYFDIATKSAYREDKEKHQVGLAVNAASVFKFELLATVINKIMAEGDTPAPWNGEGPRPHFRPDGIPTRIDLHWMTAAERAIRDVMLLVENAGASPALTDAVMLLAKARDRVADHVEDDTAPALAAE